ncbi:MAG: arylsulfatase [Verrucomicrobiales bacterium]|nr:arylsulfatase [Verrucomicrobiales bacterium]
MKNSLFRFSASLAVAFFTTTLLPAAPTPNVILIMTDDQGYGDLSITGNEIIETPNMDDLAKNGAWLKQFYVSPVCTPTRAHLMTGRYAYRTRAIDTYLGRAVMEPEEVTLPEVLSASGYATGIFGKWHLGDFYPTRAIDQGFQEAVVNLGGGLRQPANPPEGERYHDPILFHNGEPARYEGYCTDIFFDEAAKYIEEKAKAEKPFFVYLPTNAPHGPFDEPPNREVYEQLREKLSSDKNANRAGFYSMIKNIDENIGRLTTKLKDLGIEKDTVVIFLTDNGPAGGGSAGPFRGAKGQVYEGGIRTVCFMKWPGVIEAGSSVNFNAAHIDLMPTILDLCGVSEPQGVKLDGKSVRPLIAEKGKMKAQGWPDRHLFLQWHRGDEPERFRSFAVVDPQGQWKLLKSGKKGRRQQKEPDFELFNLKEDIGETKSVAAEHPEIVEKLKKEYEAWFDDVCNTRDPNFGMPPIVIGSEHQKTVVLTPQDKRVDSPETKGWWTPGHFPVDVKRAGPYTVLVRLSEEVPEATDVHLSLEVGDQNWQETVTVLRGLHSTALGEVTFPATGKGTFRARVEGENNPAKVYHVTLK